MKTELSNALQNFRQCVSDAPEGCYEDAKRVQRVIDDAFDGLMADLRSIGLKAAGDDRAWRLEMAIYDYIRQSNPEATIFPVAEGFGSSMDTPAKERVIAQAIQGRDLFKQWGLA